jgi:hypothetical protein
VSVCGPGRSLTGYVFQCQGELGFRDFLGLREKAFLHVMPEGRLAPRRVAG